MGTAYGETLAPKWDLLRWEGGIAPLHKESIASLEEEFLNIFVKLVGYDNLRPFLNTFYSPENSGVVFYQEVFRSIGLRVNE